MAPPPTDAKELARVALAFVLVRVRHDPDFHWLVNGTDTEKQLCAAYAALSDVSPEDVLHWARTTCFATGAVPLVVQLHQRLAALRGVS